MAGILWMLFVTGTTLSVPSLMGSIMCDRRGDGQQHSDGHVRQRRARSALPMRARGDAVGRLRAHPAGADDRAAMILGMLPMALGLGEGGEQNAPLGRAVIGGLLGATVTTLFVVPIIYSYLRRQAAGESGAGAAAGGVGTGRGRGISPGHIPGRPRACVAQS